MECELITTPFGRRAMSLGILASQQRAEAITPGITRNKWKLFRAICEARPALGVSDRALTVLDALLSFYPNDDISKEHSLVVFPSNAQLSMRARGMAPATLRRHLAVLVEAGLILRKDSPNGKRYARRDRAGILNQAFGFSLSPLLARAREIEGLALQAVADRELLRATKEKVSLFRRDIGKLIEAAKLAGVPGQWEDAFSQFRSLIDSVPRAATTEMLTVVIEQLGRLREEILNRLKSQLKGDEMSASESHSERHIQDSQPNYLYDLEAKIDNDRSNALSLAVDLAGRAKNTQSAIRHAIKDKTSREVKSYPLDFVLRACPEIYAYGPGGAIRGWRDLITAAATVRSMLGVTPSAYQVACSVLGPENAATVVACILERSADIKCAGGYLRDLSRRAERGEFTVGPMLMALLRNATLRAG
jgi:replication initiation protein RepC